MTLCFGGCSKANKTVHVVHSCLEDELMQTQLCLGMQENTAPRHSSLSQGKK